MNCDNGFTMDGYALTGGTYDDTYLPALPNTQCILELNYVDSGSPIERIIVFREAELVPL